MEGYNMKLYEILEPSNDLPKPIEWKKAQMLALQKLKEHNRLKKELRVGYIIYHKGFDSNYIVISWWAHENMLQMFAFASSRKEPDNFKLVDNGLNICVWDMLIHAFERNAFVNHILKHPNSPKIKNYLNEIYSL